MRTGSKKIVANFNPYHDGHGRFSSGSGGPTPEGLKPGAEPGSIKGTEADYSDMKGNWHPERAVHHDKIVAAHKSKANPAVGAPRVVMLGGGSASGKSTVAAQMVDTTNHVWADPDGVKEHIPEFKQMGEVGDHRAASYVHEESSHITKRIIDESLASGRHVLVDAVGDGSVEKLKKKADQWRKAGAGKIVGEYVTIPTDEAVKRAKGREESLRAAGKTVRAVPEETLRHLHASVSRTFPEAIKAGVFDEARLWDNNVGKGEKPHLVMEHKNGVTTIHHQDKWRAFLDKAKG